MPARFPRTSRLRRRAQFSGVFDGGRKRHGRLMTVVVLPVAGASARLGIAASRKIGGAVERNFAKRRLREIFRQSTPPAADIVVIPRRELLTAPFESVRVELESLVDGALRHGRRSQADAPQSRGTRRDLSV